MGSTKGRRAKVAGASGPAGKARTARKPTARKMPARALLAGSVAALAAAGAAPAAAQQQAGIAAAGADIIVTARKREESLQSVPLAIAAFSAEAIEREGFRSIEDIALQSPGISFRQGFGRDADRPVIRGMSNIQGAANVGFFIDGVFVTGSVASLNLDNLERVEIIRGPQAALFGRNTFAGAVNFITRKPGNDLSAQARGSIGEDGLREISSFLSGPLIRDRLFAQIDGRYYEFGGQYENAADPEDRLGRQKSLSIGGTLLARPVDNFEVIGRAYYIRDKDGFYPIMRVNRVIGQSLPVPRQLVINNNSVNCFLPELTGQFNPAQRPVTATRSRGYHCGPLGLPDQFAVNSAEFRAAGFPDNLEREEWRASLTLRLDLNDWEFVAIGAYNDRKRRSATDQDYSDVRAPFPVPGAFETIDQGGSPGGKEVRSTASASFAAVRPLPAGTMARGPTPRSGGKLAQGRRALKPLRAQLECQLRPGIHGPGLALTRAGGGGCGAGDGGQGAVGAGVAMGL